MTVFQEHPNLLQQFRDGCREAFEIVYRRYFSDVFRLLRRGFTTGAPPASVPGLDEDRSLDVLQEVFVKAFDERARLAYDGLRPYRPYVLRIAKNLRIDVARHERHRALEASLDDRTAPIDFDDVVDGQPIAPLEETLHWQTRLQATHEFLAGLPEFEQRFVHLRFVQEEPQMTVAAALNVTRRRIRTLETQIQDKLQQYLMQRGLA